MEIYGVYMNRLLRSDEFERMMNSVSEDRRAKVNKFTKPEDSNRGLLGEMLVRSIIRSKFQVRNEQIAFATGPFGKPYAAGIPSFHFNISHSGRWIVCAVDCEPVGIDIEKIEPVDYEIAKYYFSTEEVRFLMEKEGNERISYFYDLWTMKESYVKHAGMGLSVPISEIEHGPCFYKQLNVGHDYKMTACSTTEVFPEQMIMKRIYEL
jgi:4'-phosphopantetheinyl transferase